MNADLGNVEHESRIRRTADALERRVAHAQGRLLEDGAPEERAASLRDLLHYVGLLREAAGSSAPYALKLELPDGRWDVTERTLPFVPRVGDRLSLDDAGEWRVLRTQLVWPRPAGKPPREYFVCSPAA